MGVKKVSVAYKKTGRRVRLLLPACLFLVSAAVTLPRWKSVYREGEMAGADSVESSGLGGECSDSR